MSINNVRKDLLLTKSPKKVKSTIKTLDIIKLEHKTVIKNYNNLNLTSKVEILLIIVFFSFFLSVF